MNLENSLARVTELQLNPCSKTKPYDTTIHRVASVPSASAGHASNYLPDLRQVENDVDVYFKDEFVWLGF